MKKIKPGKSTLLYITNDARLADGVERALKRAGYVVEDVTLQPWRAPFTLSIEVETEVLEALEDELRRQQRLIEVWDGFVCAPISGAGWALRFSFWLRKTQSQLAPDEIGFDLRDSLTASFFVEFINEYPERAAQFDAFKEERGGCDFLHWSDKTKVLLDDG